MWIFFHQVEEQIQSFELKKFLFFFFLERKKVQRSFDGAFFKFLIIRELESWETETDWRECLIAKKPKFWFCLRPETTWPFYIAAAIFRTRSF